MRHLKLPQLLAMLVAAVAITIIADGSPPKATPVAGTCVEAYPTPDYGATVCEPWVVAASDSARA